ncbi:MAG: phosphatidylglycerol lysyltransferase domain-containing protein, partial [Eubacteriales bacterium]
PLTSGMVAHVRSVFPDAAVTENRELFDYIYDADSLISLSGKKLHQKRTHYNNFITRYNWEYTRIGENNLALLRRAYESLWRYESDEGQDFADEHIAIAELIGNFTALGLTAGVITVGGEIAAYSIGERFTCCHALIHTEKADKNYEGAFAAINREFAAHEFADCRFINREEDMGIEGLRRAKLSYQPALLNEIYSLTI